MEAVIANVPGIAVSLETIGGHSTDIDSDQRPAQREKWFSMLSKMGYLQRSY